MSSRASSSDWRGLSLSEVRVANALGVSVCVQEAAVDTFTHRAVAERVAAGRPCHARALTHSFVLAGVRRVAHNIFSHLIFERAHSSSLFSAMLFVLSRAHS